jgi:hypothetical protein
VKKIDTLREKKNGYLGKGQNSKPRNEKLAALPSRRPSVSLGQRIGVILG